ncbi:MAG: tRNA dihydrouridine synthase DusB [Pseudomonadota bacterium]
MSGVTDRPFRRRVRRFGVGLVVTEMIASEAVIRDARQRLKECRKLGDDPAEEAPLSVQLAGCDPAAVAEAAKLCADRGAAIIDINFGCPVKKVVGKAAGSAIMRDEPLAAALLEATVKAVDLPVTLKMRTGWDESSRNAPRLARIAEESGIRMITVHGRTRCQMFAGQADWAFVRQVKQAVGLPVVVNGDLTSVDSVGAALKASGADGVMIGRGAYGRPWFPAQVMSYLRSGARLADPTPEEQQAAVLEHYDAMLAHHGVHGGVRIARKHLGWYLKGLPGAAALRNEINRQEAPGPVKALIAEAYDRSAACQAA